MTDTLNLTAQDMERQNEMLQAATLGLQISSQTLAWQRMTNNRQWAGRAPAFFFGVQM